MRFQMQRFALLSYFDQNTDIKEKSLSRTRLLEHSAAGVLASILPARKMGNCICLIPSDYTYLVG